MAKLEGDVVNRVKRLPKPAKATEAMQPLFEAVSNALHAVQDQFGEQAVKKGRISIDIANLANPEKFEAIISDNGIGLAPDRFKAFCTADTPFKIERGGKGVGRLLWLDAFERIEIQSVFGEQRSRKRRSFKFQLDPSDQITDEVLEDVKDRTTPSGTTVRLHGLRAGPYRERFPVRASTLTKHFGSHFLADFILGKSPQVGLSIDGESTTFPDALTDLLVEARDPISIETEDYGNLNLDNFVFDKAASADFDGLHQLHFVAAGRTVMSRKIDGLLGLGRFGEGQNCVYHGCLTGQFLEERVNQERTHFNFDEETAEEISKVCAVGIRTKTLKEEVGDFDGRRLETMRSFLAAYPSFGFEEPEHLLNRTPKNATEPEQFAKALIPLKIRRDSERHRKVQSVIEQLESDQDVPADFAEAVRTAAKEVRAEEQRQLTEYVMRRKIVLDVLEVLIRRVRDLPEGTRDHHLEETLHQFICPLRVIGGDPKRIKESLHDLWIVDERLALARYFSSDVSFRELLDGSESDDRPDLFVWTPVHVLGLDRTMPLRRIMLVEFKKPNRKQYTERYLPDRQIMRYLAELRSGRVETFDGERVDIAPDCVFHCYVIADIVGDLDIATAGWQTTSNARGRYMPLQGAYRGSIEILEWKDLVADAKSRNIAFVEAAGVRFAK